MQHQLVIIGAGGLGREVGAVVDDINNSSTTPRWDLLGFIDDDPSKIGTLVGCRQVVGDRTWLSKRPQVWAILALGDGESRLTWAEKMPSTQWATLIHPAALFPSSSSPQIGRGSIVFGGTTLSTDVQIGDHCVIYYGCTISHDVTLGDLVTVLPGCNIAGNTQLGDCVTLGIGSKVAQNIRIHKSTCLAAGSVVVSDLPECCLAAGVPATVRKHKYTTRNFWS